MCCGSPLTPYSEIWANLELLLPGGGRIASLITEEEILEAYDFLKASLLKWCIPLLLPFLSRDSLQFYMCLTATEEGKVSLPARPFQM